MESALIKKYPKTHFGAAFQAVLSELSSGFPLEIYHLEGEKEKAAVQGPHHKGLDVKAVTAQHTVIVGPLFSGL